MSIVVVTPPAKRPIDTATARRLMKIAAADMSGDDIDMLIDAATSQIDGPSGWLGRCLITQTLELRSDSFCDRIKLPYPPYISIVSVKYDADGMGDQTVDPATYRVVGGDRPNLILASGKSWPSVTGEEECIRVRYTVGYGADGSTVPAKARQAIVLMAKSLYDFGVRNAFVSSETVEGVGSTTYLAEGAINVMKEAAEDLLSTLIVYD